MGNTKANVSAGKPAVAGAIYVGATTETAPTDATTSLGGGFTCLGYCSEDGLTNTLSIDADTIKAWGGDIVLTLEDGSNDTFQVTLIESMNVNVLKEVFGSGNVTGMTLSGGISVAVSVEEHAARMWVVDMVLKGGVLKRIVIPSGTITAIGEISYKDDDLIGYQITITAQSDNNGKYHYEYLKDATSSGS